MKTLALKAFARWAAKHEISSESLLEVARRPATLGSAVTLGQQLWKVRIAKGNRGKSAGYRTILLHVLGDRIIFLYGFEKNESPNVSPTQLADLQAVGRVYAELPRDLLELLIRNRELIDLENPDHE